MMKKTTSKHFLCFIFKTSKTLKVKMQYNTKNFEKICRNYQWNSKKKYNSSVTPKIVWKKSTYAASSWRVRIRSASFSLVVSWIYVRSSRRNFLVENRFGREQKRSITEVWLYLQAKWQRFRDYRVLLHVAQATEKIFCLSFKFKNSLLRFCKFTMLQRQQKKTFTKVDRVFGIKQFCKIIWSLNLTSMLSKLNNKLWEQMRLKMGQKLTTVNLNSKFTVSYKNECNIKQKEIDSKNLFE